MFGNFYDFKDTPWTILHGLILLVEPIPIKMFLTKILPFALFIFSSIAGNAQKDTAMETPTKNKTIACKLTSPELRKRKEEVIASLKSKILEKEELTKGYKYKFEGSDQVIDEITSFIKTERLCCDFFDFSISISGNQLWLSITGPKGAKEFMKAELDM
jgi:hypothetical protein